MAAIDSITADLLDSLPPSRLYKYCPARLSFFDEPILRFTPPMELNDVFDSIPACTSLFADKQSWSDIEPEIDLLADTEMERILIRFLFENRDEPAYKELLELTVNHRSRQVRNNVHGLFTKCQLGILCLSEIGASMRMWGNYAESHRGYVVELEPRASFFSNPKAIRLQKVAYEKERLDIPISELRQKKYEILTTKSAEWAYEIEYRYIHTDTAELPTRSIKGAEITGLAPLDLEAIKGIILGVNASGELKVKAAKFCVEHSIPLKQAKPDPTTYTLSIGPYKK